MTTAPIRTLVVDDEPLARRRVRSLLATHDGFHIVGEASDGVTALALIGEECPDLVFLDIQMPDLDGLGVAGALPEPNPLIVFVTAFDRFAATAFDLDAADYLLKPYDADRFAGMIARVRRRLGPHAGHSPAPVEHLVATARGQVRLLAIGLIERIDAAGNYAEVSMAGGGRHLVRQTLSALADQLPATFVRIHRSVIIRSDRVTAIESVGHGDGRVVLADSTLAPLSRRYRAGLVDAIAALRSR